MNYELGLRGGVQYTHVNLLPFVLCRSYLRFYKPHNIIDERVKQLQHVRANEAMSVSFHLFWHDYSRLKPDHELFLVIYI